MHPQNRIPRQGSQQKVIRSVSQINGDRNISVTSQSSTNDKTMIESSSSSKIPLKKQQNLIKQTFSHSNSTNKQMQSSKPPNDNFIHVSNCKNDKCPLQHLWKNQKYGSTQNNGKESKEFDQQFIPVYNCPKCVVNPQKYCSQRCFQQDWFKMHQFECSGQSPEARDSVLLSEVQRIEATTPFIKDANDEAVLTQEQLKLEQIFSNISKKDLELIQSQDANLGKGSYGEVQLARHIQTGILVAIKKIEKKSLTSSKIRETLIREIRIQKQLNHEYICRLYSSFEDNQTIYLALEYASKGNLFYLIRKQKFLGEDTAFYFFIQVCSGIYFLHKQGLIHRDIKPENILIKEGNIIKICDFGWCVQTDFNQYRNTFCGTLEYMAPEMIQNQAHNHTLDVWSLGILLYELVHGRAPFTGQNPREISEKIMKGIVKFKPGVSDDYKDLVNKILKYEPSERIPLIKVFDHPWVKHFEKKYNLSKGASAQPEQQTDQIEIQARKAAILALEQAEAAEKQKKLEKQIQQQKELELKKEKERLEKIKQQKMELEAIKKEMEEIENRKKEDEIKKATLLANMAIQENIKQQEKIKLLESQINQQNQEQQLKKQQQETSPRQSEDHRQKQLALQAAKQEYLKLEQASKEKEAVAKIQSQITAEKLNSERLIVTENSQRTQIIKNDRQLNSSRSIRSSKNVIAPFSPKQQSPNIEEEEIILKHDKEAANIDPESNLNVKKEQEAPIIELYEVDENEQLNQSKHSKKRKDKKDHKKRKSHSRRSKENGKHKKKTDEEKKDYQIDEVKQKNRIMQKPQEIVFIDQDLIKEEHVVIKQKPKIMQKPNQNGAQFYQDNENIQNLQSNEKNHKRNMIEQKSIEIYQNDDYSSNKKNKKNNTIEQNKIQENFEKTEIMSPEQNESEFIEEQESEQSDQPNSDDDWENQRQNRRIERRNNRMLGIERQYDSSSLMDVESKKTMSIRNEKQYESSDDDNNKQQNKSFFQKLGGFFFLGCGGPSKNDQSKQQNNNLKSLN